MSKKDTALEYAKSGLFILPLCWPSPNGECACGKKHEERDIGKAPLTNHGLIDATSDVEVIKEWWTKWASANIGVALEPSGIVVIDADNAEAVQEVRTNNIPQNVSTVTTGRGIHHYFRRQEGVSLTSKTHTGKSGKIDVFSTGYVVLPPSKHRNGKTYSWVKPLPEVIGELPEVPEWATKILAENTTSVNVAEFGAEPNSGTIEAVTAAVYNLIPGRAQAIIDGTVDTDDRSGQSFELAKITVENGIKDARTVASIVLGSTVHQAKFAQRPDAWLDACRIAARALGGITASENQTPGEALLAKSCSMEDWRNSIPEAEPLWQGNLYRGAVHLLASPPKVGKTRFLSDLLAHLTWPLIDLQVRNKIFPLLDGKYWGFKYQSQLKVLLVTEETPTAWQARPPVLCQVIGASAVRENLEGLVEIISKNRFDLIVIDTFDKVIPLEDENSNSEIITKLTPLIDATHSGQTALLLLHHHRKGGGSSGEELRGASALFGAVDVYLKFAKSGETPTGRSLEVVGRFSDHPQEKILAQLSNLQYGSYDLLKNSDTADSDDAAATVLEILQASNEPLSRRELEEKTKIPTKKLQRILKKLQDSEKAKKVGRGKNTQYK